MSQEKENKEENADDPGMTENSDDPGIVVILSSEQEVHNVLGINGVPPGLIQGIKTLLV